MKWLLLGAAAVVLLLAATFLVGLLLPRAHRAAVSALVPAPPAEVWNLITRVEDFPEWRRGVSAVERLPELDGRTRWRESGRGGSLTLEVEESDPPRLLVTRIADEGLPFGGSWTFRLKEEEGGTRVTVVEDGEVHNPLFRFMSRFVLGHDRTIRDYLGALDGRVRRGPRSGSGS